MRSMLAALLVFATSSLAFGQDRDLDLVLDTDDNCVSISNPDQVNSDADAYGDACDIDDDNDGLIDSFDPSPLDAAAPSSPESRLVATQRHILAIGDKEGMGLGRSLDYASGTLVVGAPDSTSSGILSVFKKSDSSPYQSTNSLTGNDYSRTIGIDVHLPRGADFLFGADGNASVNATQSGQLVSYRGSEGDWALYGDGVVGESTYSFLQRVRGSADGTRMVGGSYNHGNQTIGLPDNVGYLRTFDLVDDEWVETATRLQGIENGDTYGYTLELTGDGNSLFVGAPRVDDPDVATELGAVYHYEYDEGEWAKKNVLMGGVHNARLGTHISLSGDETRLAVSEPGTASIHIYDLTKPDWPSSRETLTQPFNVWEFGYTLDLNDAGDVLVVGTYSRQVLIYYHDGSSWRELADTSHLFNEPSSNYERHVKTNGLGTEFFYASPSHNYAAKRGGLVEMFELDYDSDLDGVGDKEDQLPNVSLAGRQDTDRDGLPDVCEAFCELEGLVADTDDDNDGVLDEQDAFPLISSVAFTDTDLDGLPDYCTTYCADLGLAGDADDDGDGVPDLLDAFPLDANYSKDTDGDSIADAIDEDIDGDGVANGEDAFPEDSAEQVDSDGDGVGDNADMFPSDPDEQSDLDSDGIGDNSDTDKDGDGVLNGLDALPENSAETGDNDNDGLGDKADFDDDNDGIWDSLDVDPTTAQGESSNGRMLWLKTSGLEGNQDGGLYGQSVDFAGDSKRLVVAANKIDESGVPGAQILNFEAGELTSVGTNIVGPSQAPRADRVAISADGSTVVLNDGGSSVGDTQTGAMNVFDLQEGVWSQRGDPISRPKTYDFLSRLTVNSDGSVIGMGSTTNSTPGGFAGFRRYNGTEWEVLGDYILGTDSDEHLSSGMAVNSLGNVAALGAPLAEGASGTPVDTGKVQVYQYESGAWVPRGSAIYGTETREYFGASVSFNAEGNILAVGSDAKDQVSIYRWMNDDWEQFGAIEGACSGGLTQNWRAIELDESGYKLSVSRQCNGYETHDALYYFDGANWRDTGAELDNRVGDIHQSVETAFSPDGFKKLVGVPRYDGNGLIDNGLIEIYELAVDSDGDGVPDSVDAFTDNALFSSDVDEDLSPNEYSEVLTVNVRRGAALSQSVYSGYLRLDFSGSPDSNINDHLTEDAFYYVVDSGNTQFSPWLARIGNVEELNCFNVDANNSNTVSVVSALVFVDGEGFVDPDHQPTYNEAHEYSVVVQVGEEERRLSIAHADCGFWDNDGNYTVRITSVEPLTNVGEELEIDAAFVAKGADELDQFPQDPAASVDSDNDGAPDFWNSTASAEQIAASSLMLDAFPQDPAASVDSDNDGHPDAWNPGIPNDLIVSSALSLDALPEDSTENRDTDLDGIGDAKDEDDDGDGLSDTEELALGTNPLKPDSDGDSLTDLFEVESGSRDPLVADYHLGVGYWKNCAFDDEGLKCWGYEWSTILDPPEIERVSALEVGSVEACALDSDTGKIECWARAGIPAAQGDYFVDMVLGQYHTCGLTEAGEVICADSAGGGFGVLDIPVFERPVVGLETGNINVCAQYDNGQVVCWGSTDRSGLPPTTTFTEFDSTSYGSCGVDGAKLDCFGEGDTVVESLYSNSDAVFDIATAGSGLCYTTASGLDCQGQALLGGPIALPANDFSSSAIADIGTTYACAIDNFELTCWGDGGEDGVLTAVPAMRFGDKDGDGLRDDVDEDDDGDGVDDAEDVFPLDAKESIDSDGDGIGDNDDIDSAIALVTDSALRACILETGHERVSEVTQLVCDYRDIVSLSGLDAFSALLELNIPGNPIDWSTLPSIPNLKQLYVNTSTLSTLEDLAPVASTLIDLDVSSNNLANLQGIENFPANMTRLNVLGNNISDMTPLADAQITITYLMLADNDISDISPLAFLSSWNQGEIELWDNPIRRLGDTLSSWSNLRVNFERTELSCQEIEATQATISPDLYVTWPKTCFDDPDRDYFYEGEDAFPTDPAASVDTDGDGAPDTWNDSATEEQIASSELSLDVFPDDPTETADSDGDGVGDNGDVYPNDASRTVVPVSEIVIEGTVLNDTTFDVQASSRTFTVEMTTSNDASIDWARSRIVLENEVKGGYAYMTSSSPGVFEIEFSAQSKSGPYVLLWTDLVDKDGNSSNISNPEYWGYCCDRYDYGLPRSVLVITGVEYDRPTLNTAQFLANATTDDLQRGITVDFDFQDDSGIDWGASSLTLEGPSGYLYISLESLAAENGSGVVSFPSGAESGGYTFYRATIIDGAGNFLMLTNRGRYTNIGHDFGVGRYLYLNPQIEEIENLAIEADTLGTDLAGGQSLSINYNVSFESRDTQQDFTFAVLTENAVVGSVSVGGTSASSCNTSTVNRSSDSSCQISVPAGSSPTSITVNLTIGGDGDVGAAVATVSGQVADFDLTNNKSVFEFAVTYDQDGDGVPDDQDAFPADPAASVDTDGDGAPDSWNVNASDVNIEASNLHLDAFPLDATESRDSDGDGVGDNADAFPEDPTETIDLDGDGTGANSDPDDNDPLIGVQNPDLLMAISDGSARRGESVTLAVSVSDAEGLNAVDASLEFDARYLRLDAVRFSDQLNEWSADYFVPSDGALNIAMFTVGELNGDAILLELDFTIVDTLPSPQLVRLTKLLLNDGELTVDASYGQVSELFYYSVSGSTSYWGNPEHAVAGEIYLDGTLEEVTDTTGAYTITPVSPGLHSVSVSFNEPDNRAIRAYDASLVLGMSVGALPVSDTEMIAADVNKSGGVNSADARLILRYAVGLDSIPFPNQDGIWVPLPERYEYPDLNDDVTDADFIGVLVGDVSGNWKPKETASKLLARGFDSQAITSDPIKAEVVELSENYFAVTLSLTESVEISAVELELTTSSGVSLDDWESPLISDWVTSLSDADNVITFGATKFPAGEVQEVVTLYVATTGAGESLVSALTILDEDEFEQTLNITLGTSADSDEDGLTDAEEAELGTDPNNADSDGDGLADGVEVELGTSPTSADTDGDGYTDAEEQAEGTSPTDGDDSPSVGGMPLYIIKAALDTANAAQP